MYSGWLGRLPPRNSLTRRSWRVSLARSTRPLAWGVLAWNVQGLERPCELSQFALAVLPGRCWPNRGPPAVLVQIPAQGSCRLRWSPLGETQSHEPGGVVDEHDQGATGAASRRSHQLPQRRPPGTAALPRPPRPSSAIHLRNVSTGRAPPSASPRPGSVIALPHHPKNLCPHLRRYGIGLPPTMPRRPQAPGNADLPHGPIWPVAADASPPPPGWPVHSSHGHPLFYLQQSLGKHLSFAQKGTAGNRLPTETRYENGERERRNG